MVNTMNNKKIGITIALTIIGLLVLGTITFVSADTVNIEKNGTLTSTENNTSYQLQINTSAKWRLDLTIDGNYTGIEQEGSKTINLGDSVSTASVTINQYSNGPTKVYLLKDNKVVQEASTKGSGVETITLNYQE